MTTSNEPAKWRPVTCPLQEVSPIGMHLVRSHIPDELFPIVPFFLRSFDRLLGDDGSNGVCNG